MRLPEQTSQSPAVCAGPLGVGEHPDRRAAAPEALTTGDVKRSGDVLGRELLQVPKVEELAITVGQEQHPAAELAALVEGFEQPRPDAVTRLTTAPAYLQDRGSCRLPPIRVRQECSNDGRGIIEHRTHPT
jgi:hypothetical protein